MTKCSNHSDSSTIIRFVVTPGELDLLRCACFCQANIFHERACECEKIGDYEAADWYILGAKVMLKFFDYFKSCINE